MKKVLNNKSLILLALISVLMLFATGCKNKNTAGNITYTCPMHPDVIKNEASTCPICAMDLVRVHTNKAGSNSNINLSDSIVKEGIVINLKTIYPKTASFRDTILLDGIISINTNSTKTVSSFISGRIEKLYINYNNQQISKGQKIMDIYSPELVSAQQELLYLNQSGDISLMHKAKSKLRLLGMTEADINNTLKRGKPNYSISIYSPNSGFVLETDNKETNTALNLRQGMYVNAGEALFKVYNNHTIWAEFSVNASIAKTLKPNNEIKIAAAKNKWINAKIGTIQPFYKDGQSFANIRIVLNNHTNEFKIGELINAKAISDEVTGLWIPKSAVYSSGSKNYVFIKKKKKLYPLSIQIYKIGEQLMVISGLNKTDEIAENAAHLIDPEAFIN